MLAGSCLGYYASSAAEYYGNCNATAAKAFALKSKLTKSKAGSQSKLTSKGASDNLVRDYAPLLQQYGVDLFMAGHWHYYESLWQVTKHKKGNQKRKRRAPKRWAIIRLDFFCFTSRVLSGTRRAGQGGVVRVEKRARVESATAHARVDGRHLLS